MDDVSILWFTSYSRNMGVKNIRGCGSRIYDYLGNIMVFYRRVLG